MANRQRIRIKAIHYIVFVDHPSRHRISLVSTFSFSPTTVSSNLLDINSTPPARPSELQAFPSVYLWTDALGPSAAAVASVLGSAALGRLISFVT